MQYKPGIAFCVCTHNRADYLEKCMKELVPQLVINQSILCIIDNGSTDRTKDLVFNFINKNVPVVYSYESRLGLSHARNKGWKESQYEWIFYIDDDCLPPVDFVSQASKLIESYPHIDALGGPIDPIFTSEPPAWLSPKFGCFSMPFDKVTIIDQGYIRGGCFMIKRKVLDTLGGFNTELGMKGQKLIYAEELELQDRMRQVGLSIAYAPQLRIGHFVRIDKVNVPWILQSEYARRRDKMIIDPIGIPKASLNLTRTILSRIVRIPINAGRLLTNKDYTWQRAVLDSLIPLMYRWGEFKGSLKVRKKK